MGADMAETGAKRNSGFKLEFSNPAFRENRIDMPPLPTEFPEPRIHINHLLHAIYYMCFEGDQRGRCAVYSSDSHPSAVQEYEEVQSR